MSGVFSIVGDDGRALNAKLEQDARGVVLHSRSGVDRNRDYRPALETMLARLDAAEIEYAIYLDSQPVRDQPLESRQLPFRRSSSIPQRFKALIQAMNEGSSSRGAWRRIVVIAPGVSSAKLATIVRANPSPSRLPWNQLRFVTDAHVDRAVQMLLAGESAGDFGPSRDFDVLAPDGTRLAPKKVFGLALRLATGIDAGPGHFTAGLGTPCFRALEAAGYPIVRKDDAIPLTPLDPDLAAAEGAPKFVAHLRRERKPKLAAAKRRAMVEQLGRLECERCRIVPSVALGPHGDAVIEVHHATTAVSAMADDHVTRLADLQCLCANCHRIVHRERNWQ